MSGALSLKGIPMVILACKSDPDVELQVDARQGNAIGEPYNVGLIEVTSTTASGKSKMRNGLRWLLYKLEQKMREWPCLHVVDPSRVSEAKQT